MADPTLRSYSQNYANGTTNACPYPTGIVAGDRLLLLAAGPYHPSALSGWDILHDVPDGVFQPGTLFTKIAAGTESGSSITVTFSNPDRQSVIIAAVQDPAGYPVVTGVNASSGVQPRFTTYSSLHAGSLVLTMATLRDGLLAPTCTRGTALIASTDGARESTLLAQETLTADEEYWQYAEAGTSGNGYFGTVIEMQVPAYTRALSSAYTSAVMTDTPWLFWPLAVDAQDASGNARHGTLTGRWNYGRGMGLGSGGDGSQSTGGISFIRSASLAFPAGKIAVEFIGEVTDVQAFVFSFSSAQQGCYLLGGGPRLNTASGNIPLVQPNAGVHHVVMEWTPGTDWTTSAAKIYVDGTLRPTSGTFVPPVIGTSTIQVSGWPIDNNYFLPAGYFVGGFAVYAGGLSAARVAAHWAALGTQTSGTNLPTDIASLETMMVVDSQKAPKDNGQGPMVLTDLSRKRRHMVQYNANRGVIKKPATLGGRAALTLGNLQAAAYYFQRGLMGAAAAGEMMVLFKHVADPPVLGDGRFWQIGNDGQISHIPYVDGQLYDNFGTNSRKTATNPTQSFAAGYVIYNIRSAAGAWSNYVDGVLNYTTASNTVGWSNTPFMGWPDTNEQNTDLAAVLLFSEVLTSGDRAIAYAFMDSLRQLLVITNQFAVAGSVAAFDAATLPATASVDSTAFTTEASEPLTLPTDKTGWAHFSPLIGGVYQLDTIGSNFDTGLALYTGASLGSLTLVASDDNSGGSSTSKLTATLVAGTTYHAQVGSGTGSASGTIMKLNLSAVSLTGGVVDPVILVGGWGSLPVALLKGRTTATADALPGG